MDVVLEPRKKREISSVRAHIPASSANMGPGFDVNSIALQTPHLEMQVALRPSGSRIITMTGTFGRDATTDPDINAAGKALDNFLSFFRKSAGYHVKIKAEIPPRKGLGLSGAESVGAILCANRLLNLRLPPKKIVEFAAVAEPSHHMDNVSASALGGFNICYTHPLNRQVNFITIFPPTDLGVAIIVPDIEKKSTEDTRHLVPLTVVKEKYVASMSYIATVSAAFARNDVNAIIETLPWDFVVESARADGGAYGKGVTAEFLREEKQILSQRYHVAETISGAGPSRALWFSRHEDAKAKRRNHLGLIAPAVEVVSERFESLGHKVEKVYITRPSGKGAAIESADHKW